MSMSALSKQKATTLTRAGQAALALLVIAGVGAVMMSSRLTSEPEHAGPLVMPTVELPGAKSNVAPISNEIDFAGTADRLAAVSNHPKPVVAAQTDPAKPVQPIPVNNELKYLGAVGVGANKVALISEGGRQRFVNLNDDLPGGKVQAISESEIRVGSKTIALAGRSNDVLTRAGRPAPVMPGGPNMNAGRNGPTTLQPYNPNASAVVMEDPIRQKSNIPDYVPRGEEQAFLSIRESLRATEKVNSEDELNELASKLWEEKKGGSPELDRYRKERGDK